MTGKTRRSFSRRGRIPWMGLCVAATLAALASCAPRSEHWSNAESPKQLRVDRTEFHHVVRFGTGEASPNAAAVKSLNGFLSRHADGHGVETWISGGDTLLDVRRQASVMTHMRSLGLNARLGGDEAAPKPSAGTVRVTLVRHVVTLPNCGDWSKNATTDRANQPSSNFGCATAANLGLMVADPGVLVRGADIGPGDGDALARGVKTYREGKHKKSSGASPLVIQATGASGGEGK